MPRDVGVVVVAAGRGVRAGGGVPKQFRDLAGVPLLLRALRPFTGHPDVAQVALVLPAESVVHPPEWLAGLRGEGLVFVAGGSERSDSVRAGLDALRAECRTVLVHDGARPFVERDLIDAVIAGARAGEGIVPAIPEGDTLKQVAADGKTIERTVPRDGLWRAQTPQGFPREMLVAAYQRPRTAAATDDAGVVEAGGGHVRIIPGSPRNIKVTSPADLELAELLARVPR
ncbi:MAG TPA: 2-C-methyl-D-erythritol 4-phosphate cytidylyltransferase [Gemmatimonadales bacterium]|nr:2-C-methyl-D-erythritol 4-phosphate cytidylyltransferase [Gemmatimonadales bacterium]